MQVDPAEPTSAVRGGRRGDAGAVDAAIIIFGAAVWPDGRPSPTLRYRVEAASRFGARFRHPLFIPTGAKGRYGAAEAVVMARLLNGAGFPDTNILTEQTGTDTLSSVRAVRKLLTALQSDVAIFVATSAYHLPRCLLLLRLAGIAARACPPPSVPASTNRWLRWFWRLRETLALPYDALLVLLLRIMGRF